MQVVATRNVTHVPSPVRSEMGNKRVNRTVSAVENETCGAKMQEKRLQAFLESKLCAGKRRFSAASFRLRVSCSEDMKIIFSVGVARTGYETFVARGRASDSFFPSEDVVPALSIESPVFLSATFRYSGTLSGHCLTILELQVQLRGKADHFRYTCLLRFRSRSSIFFRVFFSSSGTETAALGQLVSSRKCNCKRQDSTEVLYTRT